MRVTLCEISGNPAAYNGKRLVFRARYFTDHIERSLLLDENCSAAAVLPYLREHAVGADAFNDAVDVREPLHLDQTIVATFVGFFHFSEKPEMCMLLNRDVCHRSFEIEKVEDLVLTMVPKKTKK